MNVECLDELISGLRMIDGARINREPGGHWSVCDMDSKWWLCARGEDASEVFWDLDRRTHFATIEGAVDAWGAQFARNKSVWKGDM